MTESLKFGPKWLRNSLSNSPPKEEEMLSSDVMSNFRYSREEFLYMINEKNSKKKPEILPLYKRLYVENCQTPLSMQLVEEEKPTTSRLFLNSNIKHGAPNWRKNGKDETTENWRHPSNKDNKEGFSSLTSFKNDLRKNWRDKPNEDDQMTSQQLHVKSYNDVKSEQKEPFAKKSENYEAEKLPEWAKYSPNKSSEWEVDKALFCPFDSSNMQRQEVPLKKKMDLEYDDVELNLKKLEKDLLMNLSDLTIDDEKKPEKVSENKQQNLINWFYIDPLGKIQGPFNEEEMTLWHKHGFFCDTLMIRRSIDSNFISLQQLIHAFGNAQPFVVASSGFPIPKFDNPLENNFKPPSKVLNQPVSNNIQWNNMMFNDSNQYQPNNNMQFSQPQQAYQYLQNRPLQSNVQQQIDPRILNMSRTNPYIQSYNNMCGMNYQQNRPPSQITPPLINQVIKNQMSAPPNVNNFSQPMIQQMPSLIPANPIQKLLYELQKQKEIEMQRQAMYFQQNNPLTNNSNNVLMKSLNDQFLLQQQQQQQQYMNKLDNINQNQKIHQNYFSSNNGVSNSRQMQQHQQQPQEGVQEKPISDFDADDEGEFKVVGNLKRKKFQKEVKEKAEKSKPEVYAQSSKSSIPKLNHTNNNDEIKHENKNLNEERSKFPALPAPWIDKVKKDHISASENLRRIQLEEEEIRNIEMQLKREKEKEMNQKTAPMTWNTILTDKIQQYQDEKEEEAKSFPKVEDSIWNDRSKNSKANKNSTNRLSVKQPQQPPKQDAKMMLNIEKENEFKNWCIEMLNKMNTKIDIPVFVNFLAGLESPFEIEDYVKDYLGDTIESTLFTRKFLERRSSYRKATKIVEIDDDLCAPPKAINPGSNEEAHKTHRKSNKNNSNNNNNVNNNKKSRKTMKIADVNILGFKGTAASNRIVGELHEDEY